MTTSNNQEKDNTLKHVGIVVCSRNEHIPNVSLETSSLATTKRKLNQETINKKKQNKNTGRNFENSKKENYEPITQFWSSKPKKVYEINKIFEANPHYITIEADNTTMKTNTILNSKNDITDYNFEKKSFLVPY